MGRFQRHNRILTGLRRLFPVSASKPDATREIAPWLSDVVQFTYALPGDIRAAPDANPAPGVNYSLSVPGGEIWRIFCIAFTLVTDATVANREMLIRFLDPGGGLVNLLRAETVQPASQAVSYFADHRGRQPLDIAGAQIYLPLPYPLFMFSGMSLDTAVINLQAGDQISQPFIWREVRAHPGIPA